MNYFVVVALLLLATVASAASVGTATQELDLPSGLQREDSSTTGYMSTREEILATREQRKKQFSGRVDAWKEQLGHHESGRRRLSDPEAQSIQKKIEIYQRKLEWHLEGEMDDRQVDRILAREEISAEMNSKRRSRSEL
jgi:hypothetical protein